jgi:hypothetical protein
MDTDLLVLLVPAITPLIILGVKLLWVRVPSIVLPYIAPLIGAALTMLGNATTTMDVSPILGLFFGAAGVGLREMLDQTKQRINATKEKE